MIEHQILSPILEVGSVLPGTRERPASALFPALPALVEPPKFSRILPPVVNVLLAQPWRVSMSRWRSTGVHSLPQGHFLPGSPSF
jgi:hypothetical protein